MFGSDDQINVSRLMIYLDTLIDHVSQPQIQISQIPQLRFLKVFPTCIVSTVDIPEFLHLSGDTLTTTHSYISTHVLSLTSKESLFPVLFWKVLKTIVILLLKVFNTICWKGFVVYYESIKRELKRRQIYE
jgi:hypothetical protein